jgi:hypothetical protein
MKRVYFAHPLRNSVEENKQKIAAIIRQALIDTPDILPLSPIHNFSFVDPVEYDAEHGMELCFNLLKLADELWVHGKYWESEGCCREIVYAKQHGISIKYPEVQKCND